MSCLEVQSERVDEMLRPQALWRFDCVRDFLVSSAFVSPIANTKLDFNRCTCSNFGSFAVIAEEIEPVVSTDWAS